MVLKFHTDQYTLNREAVSRALEQLRSGLPFDLMGLRLHPAEIFVAQDPYSSIVAVKELPKETACATANLLSRFLAAVFPITQRKFRNRVVMEKRELSPLKRSGMISLNDWLRDQAVN